MKAVHHDTISQQFALLAACLGFGVVILDVSVVNVALDSLHSEFSGTISSLEWVVNGYTLTFAAFLLSSGSISDRLGPKQVFVFGFLLFAMASLACGVSTNFVELVFSRIVQGVGAALLVPASLAIVNNTFSDKSERSRAVGLWAAAGGLALALGPVIGGMLISLSGWRAIFMINVPIAIIGILLTIRFASNIVHQVPRKLDWAGQILGILSLGGLTASMIEAGSLGWSHPLVQAAALLFVVATVLFLLVEARSSQPMLPLSLFHNPTFSGASAIGVMVNFAFYGLIFMFSLFFQTVWHYSALITGLAFLPMTVAIMITNIAAGKLAARNGAKPVLLAGCIVAAIGYVSIIPFVSSSTYWLICIQFCIAGAGIGLAVPSMTNAMISAVEPEHVGIASGVLNASRQIGGLIGVATTGLLLSGLDEKRFAAGLNTALTLAAVTLIVSAIITITAINQNNGKGVATGSK